MSVGTWQFSVEPTGDGWKLAGTGPAIGLVNDFLEYLSSRNYSPRTVRSYAFDLLHFLRSLAAEQLELDTVDTDALLRYLATCRTTLLPHQQGANVYSIRDGRNTGYAARTINRRLAALSALFTFRSLRDPRGCQPGAARSRAAADGAG